MIAIENARLLNDLQQRTSDLQELLEYQTATSDVLKVISQSGAELEPVLQTLVETAARICEGENAFIFRLHDGRFHLSAAFGFTPEYKAFIASNPITRGPGTLVGRTALEERVVHIIDAASDPHYNWPESQQLGGFRTMLGVPLSREKSLVGVIALTRSRVEPFTEKQIQLVTTFADQAVIAIENARLFNELRARTDELAQRQAELRVTFDNMADGVAMFDADLRLAAWNRNFQELLQLPDEFLAEPPRLRRIHPLSGHARRVRRGRSRGRDRPAAGAARRPLQLRADPPRRHGHRNPPQPDAGWRRGADLWRHHREEALGAGDPRRA